MSEQRRYSGLERSRSAAGDRNPWLIAVVVSIATFMEVLDTAIANVSLRYIAGSLGDQRRRKHVGGHHLSHRQRRRAAGERLAVERHRPQALLHALRRDLHRGLAVVRAGLKPRSLILFRILQGLGGGGMPTSEQAMLADTFPPRERAQAFALYGIAVIVAPTVGPDARRLDHRQLFVALDLLHQRADRDHFADPGAMAGG